MFEPLRANAHSAMAVFVFEGHPFCELALQENQTKTGSKALRALSVSQWEIDATL